MFLTHLECTACRDQAPAVGLQTVCSKCGSPWAVRYDLQAAADTLCRAPGSQSLRRSDERPHGLWRWHEVLPAADPEQAVTLGEGATPLLRLPRLGGELGVALWMKDESRNPTGSFKDRGMSVAVTMALELGARALATPSAGNAGGALAAYGARAGLPVHLAMPRDVPAANRIEAGLYGAQVTLIDGTIADCGKWIKARCEKNGWFDLSTLKEPYRVEGKKTMGYELVEQLGWRTPATILYPTGGGTGLVGMWKAFGEMQELGLLDPEAPLPRMVAVQASGCAPVVDAFRRGADRALAPEAPHTVAAGLRVPGPIGDRWMLRVLRESMGTAIAVTDDELIAGCSRAAKNEGVFCAPEGGALVAALEKGLASGEIPVDGDIVLFNTGTGLKYLECFA